MGKSITAIIDVIIMKLLTNNSIIAKIPNIISDPIKIEKYKFVVNINGTLVIIPHNPPSSMIEIIRVRQAIDTRIIAAGKIHLIKKSIFSGEKWYKIEWIDVYKPIINEGERSKIVLPFLCFSKKSNFLILPRGS